MSPAIPVSKASVHHQAISNRRYPKCVPREEFKKENKKDTGPR